MAKHKQWVIGATLTCLWACGSPEQATVEQLFRAAGSNDSVTVAAMSAVSPPGPLESWEVVEISSRSTEPFELPELLAQLEAAEKARDAALEKGREYMAEYEVELNDQIIPKLQDDPDFEYSGKMGEIQAAWIELVEERKETERAYQDLKRTVDDETRLATKSVIRQVALGDFTGDVAVTEMLLMLKLEEAEPKPYTVTLHKYDLAAPGSDRTEQSRWVVVDIKEKAPT